MVLGTLPPRSGDWLRSAGPEADVAISTRVRLARNIEGFPFRSHMAQNRAEDLVELLRREVLALEQRSFRYIDLKGLSTVGRRVLVERRLISQDHAAGDGDNRGLAVGDGDACLMVNEEDHLRLQILRSGFCADDAYDAIEALDTTLATRLAIAFSPTYGYLTACPTNTGTGLRVSVMLHLPALVLTHKIARWLEALHKKGVVVRGYMGEGTRALGDLYQVSNGPALGRTEKDLVREVSAVTPRIIQAERKARARLMKDGGTALLDTIRRVTRATLAMDSLTTEEALELLSLVRLGIVAGLIDQPPLERVSELFLWCQSGHLQHLTGVEMGAADRDNLRLGLVQRWLHRHLQDLA